MHQVCHRMECGVIQTCTGLHIYISSPYALSVGSASVVSAAIKCQHIYYRIFVKTYNELTNPSAYSFLGVGQILQVSFKA